MATWRGGATSGPARSLAGSPDETPGGRAADTTTTGLDSGAEAHYLDACVADVEGWLGTELTAYLTGADSPAELSAWVAGANGDAPAASRRLQAASEVVDTFAAAGLGTRARAWLREVSPLTGGRSPADLVRYARSERLLDQVREAAARNVLSLA